MTTKRTQSNTRSASNERTRGPSAGRQLEQIAAPDFANAIEDDSSPADAAEPEEDAAVMIDDPAQQIDDLEDHFGSAIDAPSPYLHQLGRSIRLPVAFRLDQHYQVHDLRLGGRPANSTRHRLAAAVALHLTQHAELRLDTPGAWVHIPAIGSDRNLADLAREALPEKDRDDVYANFLRLMKSFGSFYKGFAVELPNHDIVALQALIDRARSDAKATRAGVLRINADLDAQASSAVIAGETWSRAELNERTRRSLDRRGARTR